MSISSVATTQDDNIKVIPKPQFTEHTRADASEFDAYTLRPYNPSALYQKTGSYSIYDDMREDDQIAALLLLKKAMVLDTSWAIECEDETIHEFLTDCLNVYLDELFEKKLYNILSAIDYGFSLTEKIYKRQDTKYGNKIVLGSLKTRPPHTFEIEQDDYGNITIIKQYTSSGKDIPLKPEKLIHYIYQKEFDNPYGRSELNEGVYRAWWSKVAIIKFWNIYLERYGMPTVVGKYDRNLVSEKTRLKSVLKNIQSKSSIIIPEGVEVDLLSGGNSGESDYERAISFYNMSIARKMLVPDLLGFGGTEVSGGSYALGKEHFGIFYSVIEHIRKELERIINKEIINPLVLWNFGNKCTAEFMFQKVDENKKESNMKMWLESIKTGKMPVGDDHVNWFLNNIEAPEISDEELARIKEEKNAFKDNMLNNGNNKNNDIKETTEEDVIEDGGEKKKDSNKDEKREDKNFAKKRKTNTKKIEKELNDIEDRYKPKMADIMKLSINALIDDIKRKKIIEKKRLDLISKLDIKYKDRIANVVRSIMKEARGKGFDSVDGMKKFAIIGDMAALSNEDIAEWIEQYAFYVSDMEAGFILGKVKPALMEGIRSGMGTAQIVGLVEDALSGYNIGLDANRIETIVRTVTAKAFNEGRAELFNEFGDEIVAYEYDAIDDMRISALCKSLDGKIFKPSQLQYYNPPNHFNCRSLIKPIFRDEDFDGNYSAMPSTDQAEGGFLTLDKEKK